MRWDGIKVLSPGLSVGRHVKIATVSTKNHSKLIKLLQVWKYIYDRTLVFGAALDTSDTS